MTRHDAENLAFISKDTHENHAIFMHIHSYGYLTKLDKDHSLLVVLLCCTAFIRRIQV